MESTGNLTPEDFSKRIHAGIVSVLDVDKNDITVLPYNMFPPTEVTNNYIYDAKFMIYYLRNLNDYLLTFNVSYHRELTHDDLVHKHDLKFYGSVVKVIDEEVDEQIIDFETKSNSLLDILNDIKKYIDNFGNDGGDDEPEWSPDDGGWDEFEKEMETHEIVGARLRQPQKLKTFGQE